MEISVLPQDLSKRVSNGLQIIDYKRYHGIQKAKIYLSMNTISFLKSGTKIVFGGDAPIKIEYDHFAIMKAGNCLMTEKLSDSNKIYKSILFFFSDSEVLNFLEMQNMFDSNITDQRSIYTYQFDGFIENFVVGLEHILKLPEEVQTKLLKAKFEELMLYLVHQHSADFLNSLVYAFDEHVNRLVIVSENNKFNKLTLEELAFLSNMSISTFKREFSRHYKKTPMKWFGEKRLNHIAFLLQTKRKRPIELYEEAGYRSFSSFVQAFKKNFGMTPKQYQAQY